MASFFDLTIGQEDGFRQALAAAGFKVEDIKVLIKYPTFAARELDVLLRSIRDHKVPDWYVDPKEQIAKARKFLDHWNLLRNLGEGFTKSDIPSIPDFVPATPTEVLMLAVYLPSAPSPGPEGWRRSKAIYWDEFTPTDGYNKQLEWDIYDTDKTRLSISTQYRPGIRWVGFDPNANTGVSPYDAGSKTTSLASVEVLMALSMFPKWPLSWNADDQRKPRPNLAGYHIYREGDWCNTLGLVRRPIGSKGDIVLVPREDTDVGWSTANPTVRDV